LRGEFTISGFTNRDLCQYTDKNSGQITRLLKRLRVHGLIKKVGRRYKYYFTEGEKSAPAVAIIEMHVKLPGCCQWKEKLL